MSRVTLSARAKTDLAEIHGYIAQDKPLAADRQIAAFFERFQTLAAQPLLGEARSDLRPALRTFSVGNFVVCYFPTNDGIRIARVLRGSRDIVAIFRKNIR
ncbi:MAG TPA: type II toxin-antitoxin system RelE/ParE family toxin [Pirellulales bacterium]|nr:type II toxin-antitoxin system RelE/ParE family toxin [Pirellulales bacterium]